MTVKDLMDNLNQFDFSVFPQKNNPGKSTISIKGEDGKRYFVTRVAAGLNENGTSKYQWARGNAFREREDN